MTIRTVARRAGVGRSTFYTHYGDLAELHSDWFGAFARHPVHGEQPLAFTRALFAHAAGQRAVWKACDRRHSSSLRRSMKRDVLALVRERLQPDGGSAASREASARLIAGAFCELFFWWIDTEASLSADRLDAQFQEFVARAVPGIRSTDAGRARHDPLRQR